MRAREIRPNSQNEDVQVLIDLGLTSLQARVYLALSSLGNATMKSVAKVSGIARQDIYRIIPQLHKLGLAEKIVATPSRYKATPLDDGVNVLLRHKSLEYSRLQTKTVELIENFRYVAEKSPPREDDSKFLIISEKKLLYKTLDKKNSVVQTNLLVSGTWESTRGALFGGGSFRFKDALKRGVMIRWITEEHEEDQSTIKPLQKLVKNPLFEIRYFAPPIPLQAAIYDKKEVVMCIATLPSSDVTSISSNSAMFVRVALNYWEEVWNASLKDYSKGMAPRVSQNMLAS